MEYREMFRKATGKDTYPWQNDLVQRSPLPSIVSVPTGLGKTAGVILGWIWRRHYAEESIRVKTPRRLVYCLPMRVLVEQTRDCAVRWLTELDLYAYQAPEIHPPNKVAVHVLMGGDLEMDWDAWPEREQILIGTQDMLLSRALNRGYAMSRFRWPMHFGLLNNDSLWVMDEVQLMGNGLATTTQMQAFRRKLGTEIASSSIWMSATMRSEWLATVDFDLKLDATDFLDISEKDRNIARNRLFAKKHQKKADFEASKDGKAEADLAIDLHSPNSLTLIIVNTVKRAQAIFEALQKKKPDAKLVLLHSRFRPQEREKAVERLLEPPPENGRIAVTTQVVEAGVDVSAKLLITDLAPWPSLIQRFGRCNRGGEYNQTCDAQVIWICPPDLSDDKKLKSAPYTGDELRDAGERLGTLSNVGPESLPRIDTKMEYSHVIRRKDLIELFDTTPDLAGADIDVSRFIRETDDRSIQVFWRDFDDDPKSNEKGPARNELCAVPIGDFTGWLSAKNSGRRAWRWDHLNEKWIEAKLKSIFPGLVLMLRANDGGYENVTGWNGKSKRTEPVAEGNENDANDRDLFTGDRTWQTITEHTDRVDAEIESLLKCFPGMDSATRDKIMLAARWHDAGKAHEIFQQAIPDGAPYSSLWAKSEPKMKRYERPGFRHELASGLAILINRLPDLVAYLAAAHHGKVRSSIRSLPHEKRPPENEDTLFARGIWDGDILQSADLGGGVRMPETKLSLSYMRLGEDNATGPSWLARMLALRDEMGPFRLAFFETLLRIADWRASNVMEVK